MKLLKLITQSAILSMGLVSIAWAGHGQTSGMIGHRSLAPMDKVAYKVSVEQWATTTSALVTVTINANLGESGLETIHGQIEQNLKKISPNSRWHITSFNRSQSQSGLEQLTAQAEARIDSSHLGNIRSKAKSISKPGEKYTISDIVYKPSLKEIEAVQKILRNQVYKDIKQQLTQLNSVYPGQNFHVYRINFLPERFVPTPGPRMMAMAKTAGSMDSSLPVSDKVRVDAIVVLATDPKFPSAPGTGGSAASSNGKK